MSPRVPQPVVAQRSPLQPSFPKMMWRGLRGHCPICNGKRAWFTGWFSRADRCRTCGFRWERNTDGFMTGSMTINIIITFATIAITMGIVTVVTYPDLPVASFAGALIGVAVILPVLIHPPTCTMWSAVDLAMRPLDVADLASIDRNAVPGAASAGGHPTPPTGTGAPTDVE